MGEVPIALGDTERVHRAARTVEERLIGVAQHVEEGMEGASGLAGRRGGHGALL
jgi:hypothetical protein